MSTERPLEAFGYRAETLTELVDGQVAEGKDAETLQPRVVLYVKSKTDAEQVGFAMDPDLADFLADELKRWSERSRRRHFEWPG